MTMTTALALKPASLGAQIERVLISGDLSKLNADERVSYYNAVCTSVGLNPLTRPFDYLRLNGKELLYANKNCTDQLRKIHSVSIADLDAKTVGDIYVVVAKAQDAGGRTDAATGAVNVKGLSGDALANALMKTETKAKRRVTLSICGLSMLDETEVETIPGAARIELPKAPAPASTSAAPATSGASAPASSTAQDDPMPDWAEADEADTEPLGDLVDIWIFKKLNPGVKDGLGEWTKCAEQEPKRTLRQNSRIHALETEIGLTEEEKRKGLGHYYAKTSTAVLSRREASDYISKLEARLKKWGNADARKGRADAKAQRQQAKSERGLDTEAIGIDMSEEPSHD
jgi:hypothetical protein